MRYPLITLLLLPLASLATPKEATHLLAESRNLRAKATHESSFEKKSQIFKAFEATLKSTIKDYVSATPNEGGSAEEKVVKLSFRFEPLAALATRKPTPADCEKTRHQIEFLDKSGKGEENPLTEGAAEALKWVDLFCK